MTQAKHRLVQRRPDVVLDQYISKQQPGGFSSQRSNSRRILGGKKKPRENRALLVKNPATAFRRQKKAGQ